MPALTLNIADRGTPTSGGGVSSVGHMWYLVDNGVEGLSHGFSPDVAHQGNPLAQGQVNTHGFDDAYYQGRYYSRTIEITESAEAVSLSPTLGISLAAFSSAGTRDARRARLDGLLTDWAQGSDFWQSLETTLDGNVSGLPAGMTEAQYPNLVGVLEVFNGMRFYSSGTSLKVKKGLQ